MRKGFTFIELLLAISIFAVVSVMLYSVFNMGITAWRKMEAILERYQELRLLTDRMGQELRNALDLDLKESFDTSVETYDFQGVSNKIIFYTLKNGEIRRLIYSIEQDTEKSKELERDIFLIKRDEKPFIPLPFKEDDFQGEVVFDLVKELTFSYLERKSDTEENWFSNWGETDLQKNNLPTQVKIKIVFFIPQLVPISRKVDYQEISIEKYVDIVSAKRVLP
ncbi:MAG: prepilin-type N-terminal cleavage/methylation domain-containing protein [Candidatus Omnitrophica bacterium]|nr:prepilin-type N-terminal cleavage/methylation domain-containing protein [Candidatus Omnitrophota bacterium]